ncbi:MAG: CPBP family intramembrane metalloprotease [candidate division Zixibacteria bacterium]|nr:CPBP family intramembrane metalloprotease [candidate division Zixibacteria bacterium]
MINKDEWQANIKPLTILLYTSIALTVFRYYGSAKFYADKFIAENSPASQYYYFLSSFVLLGLIPVLIWKVGFKHSLKDMGLSFGDTKKSLLIIAVGLPLMAVMAYFSSKDPSFLAEYPLYRGLAANQGILPIYILMYSLYYIGWEFYFRGFMLFGLRESYGEPASILIQTIPSCLLHIGKPDAEIFASIVAGIAFGWLVLRCRSIWPIFIFHFGLGVFLDLFIIYG